MGLWAAPAQALPYERFFCDSEVLTYDEAIGRIEWAWACGFTFCTCLEQRSRRPQDALSLCGYPVFNEQTPFVSKFDRATGDGVCYLDPDPDPVLSWAYFLGNGLQKRLALLTLKASCKLAPEPACL